MFRKKKKVCLFFTLCEHSTHIFGQIFRSVFPHKMSYHVLRNTKHVTVSRLFSSQTVSSLLFGDIIIDLVWLYSQGCMECMTLKYYSLLFSSLFSCTDLIINNYYVMFQKTLWWNVSISNDLLKLPLTWFLLFTAGKVKNKSIKTPCLKAKYVNQRFFSG